NNAVISVAGNFDESRLLDAIKNKFSNWRTNPNLKKDLETPEYNFEFISRNKEIEQVHLCLGFKGVKLNSDEMYPLLVLNNILGGSMSSRLFQSIREERGLAYSIYSYPSVYKNGGSLVIYAGTNPNQLEDVSKIIYNEIQDIIEN